jgi:2-dehydropantoate 2-reductase
VLQDLLKGRRCEVGLINGLVVAESKKRGYAAPANARIAEIVQRIEAGVLKPGPDNLALAVRGS